MTLDQVRVLEISIHAPLTGCDIMADMLALLKGISIHAPLTGCDAVFYVESTLAFEFQSTHP